MPCTYTLDKIVIGAVLAGAVLAGAVLAAAIGYNRVYRLGEGQMSL